MPSSKRNFLLIAAIALLVALPVMPVRASRIQDLCDIGGVRQNQLIGYGLVVGLAGTGDRGQARFTVQSTAAMLRRLGTTIDPAMIQTRNAAAVMVTATLPPSAASGTHIDVVVSSLGNARSLSGGVLLQTPLFGADRNVYAAAQGPVLFGGFEASGATGTQVRQNHTTVGRVPDGAIVERTIEGPVLGEGGEVTLQLRDASFITATRIVEVINTRYGASTARATGPTSVKITIPEAMRDNAVQLVAEVQALEVEPDAPARVVIDERTGTIVLGADVRLMPCAVAQGGLQVQVREAVAVSQPNALAGGQTAVVPQSDVSAEAQQGVIRPIAQTASLDDVVQALNALGARPRELVPILEAMRTAGALRARIEAQ